ncbi:hypothetical protein FKW77_001767 [Venturia effusa]|uniref:Uncharacterized protein n=1 Tax=Venturia effusa TaxID=50376 RepID=A0A517LNF7_9PEZI|nr:hypothetical protein FKW77_001767 [Venturia effusa]
MPRPNIRPWRDQVELLSVRKLLYPETNKNDPETLFRSQRLGVNIVNTWKRRCRVPHYIDFTAVLVDAQLQHNVEQHSTFTIRAIYSAAFARFVTGTCDMGQNSATKRSMYEMAEDKDMPEKWVELRHEITHGEIPDLRVLEFSVDAALSWLWVKFWTNLDGPANGDSEAQTDIRTVLRSFASRKRDEIKLSHSANNDLCSTTTRDLLRICRRGEGGMDKLVSVLLEEKLMLPSPTQTKLIMKGAYLIWDGLLQTIAAKRRLFYSTLTEGLLNRMTPDSMTAEDGTLKEAPYQWLLHLVTATSWQKYLQHSDSVRTAIVERCITHPDVWSKRLARLIIDGSDNDFQEQWEPYFESSFLDVKSEEDKATPPRHGQNNNIDEITAMSLDHKPYGPSLNTPIDLRNDRDFPSDLKHETPSVKAESGWRLWEGGWLPRPIGFPHPHQKEIS